jgi:hypothetical protein
MEMAVHNGLSGLARFLQTRASWSAIMAPALIFPESGMPDLIS